MSRPKCLITGKDRYPNALECQLAIADIALYSKHHRHQRNRETPTRSYQCNHCGDYHMTSKDEDRNRESVSN